MTGCLVTCNQPLMYQVAHGAYVPSFGQVRTHEALGAAVVCRDDTACGLPQEQGFIYDWAWDGFPFYYMPLQASNDNWRLERGFVRYCQAAVILPCDVQ